jgi:tyrosyl-DNA phosphodiesterase 2
VRHVPVGVFDATTGRWIDIDAAGAVERDELTLTTFNIWFDSYFAEERYRAIAELLSRHLPDVMVFQEVTPLALTLFLAQPWVREHYLRAAVVGEAVGDYGMLILSRVPITRVTHTRLPIRFERGFLRAELTINGRPQVVCSAHLDSGKASKRLRGWQLRRIFRALRTTEDAVILGDFNMRDDENGRIAAPYRDVWPALRPHEDGFTEDTSINLTRFDSNNKHRHVRFDRVLVKGPAWSPASIDLLGTEPVSNALPRVFPSDHFGVRCRLVRNVAAPVRQRRRSWLRWLAR